MPDWTYAPLLEPALRRLPDGRRRTLRLAARVRSLPGGAWLIRGLADARPLPELHTVVAGRGFTSPVGISRDVDPEGLAGQALYGLGAGFVEIAGTPPVAGLVECADAREARAALGGGAVGVIVPEEALDDLPAGTLSYVRTDGDDPAGVVALLDRGATLVGIGDGLRRRGPGLPQQCNEAVASARHSSVVTGTTSWLACLLIGLALLATGTGASIISFGPVLLGYDKHFLRGGTSVLDHGRLLDFVQHDRITFAGIALGIGVLYTGLAWFGVRPGWRWARTTLTTSCTVGMLTLFLFFGFGYFEPLHALVTAGLVPLLLAAALGARPTATWVRRPEPSDAVRRRALLGQLVLVLVAIGLLGGGVVIATIAVTDVFVSTDVSFIGVTPSDLADLSDRIIPFVAHDRAGFGGALIAEGLAMLGLALWGFRPGERWVWWTLLVAALLSGGPAIGIHWAVGYTSFAHLLPVYVAGVLTVVGLALSRSYLLGEARSTGAPTRSALGISATSSTAPSSRSTSSSGDGESSSML